MKGFGLILILVLTIPTFGQDRIEGIWKSTDGLARDVYTFDTLNNVTREFHGCLSYYKLQGQYRTIANTIFITYDKPTDLEKKIYFRGGTPQLDDTIYIINQEKLARRIEEFDIYLYARDRDMPVFTVDSTGLLNITIRDFGDTIYLKTKWIDGWRLIDSWTSSNSDYLEIKNYQLPLHSGTNEFRITVKQFLKPERIKKFKIVSDKETITIESTKITDTLHFSSETYYELYDSFGNILSTGTANKIDFTALAVGGYILKYDNDWTKIKKK